MKIIRDVLFEAIFGRFLFVELERRLRKLLKTNRPFLGNVAFLNLKTTLKLQNSNKKIN